MGRLLQMGGRGDDDVRRVDCVVNSTRPKPWMPWTEFANWGAPLYDEASFAEKRRTDSPRRAQSVYFPCQFWAAAYIALRFSAIVAVLDPTLTLVGPADQLVVCQ